MPLADQPGAPPAMSLEELCCDRTTMVTRARSVDAREGERARPGHQPDDEQASSCPVDSFTRITEYYESSGQVVEECIEGD